jgi:hypothetical protein
MNNFDTQYDKQNGKFVDAIAKPLRQIHGHSLQ